MDEAYASPSLSWRSEQSACCACPVCLAFTYDPDFAALALLATYAFLLLAYSDYLYLHRPTAFLRSLSRPGVSPRGKALTPSNYTVVRGVFIQSEPDFNATDYDGLSDSFGLIDKSPNRWRNFSR